MSFETRWGGDPEDLTIMLSGSASTPDLVAAYEAVRSAPQYRPGLRVLLDERRVDWSSVTSDDIRRRAEAVLKVVEPEHRHRVATIVDQKAAFGLMRMMQAYTEDGLPIVERIFYDFDSARAWLAESPD